MKWMRWLLLLGLGTAGLAIYAEKSDIERYLKMRQM